MAKGKKSNKGSINILGLFGFAVGFGLIVWGIISGGNISDFIEPQSLAITVGGTIGALMMSFPSSVIKNIPKMFMMFAKPRKYDPQQYIDDMVEYSKIARSKSLLALEDAANDCTDPFVKSSLMLIVDANDSDKVREMLDDAINFMTERHQENYSFFTKLSVLAPAFGMIGTLVGLINMLKNLSSDPDGLGPRMSVALITTFYGCILANLIGAPIASRLKASNEEEILCMQIVEEGALGIISGANPRYIQERLELMLAPKKEGKKTKKK